MLFTKDFSSVKQVVFAGGGNRCFWQAGFWSTVAEPLKLNPSDIISVSAGSAISCAVIANKIEDTLKITVERAKKLPSNRELKNLFKSAPVFPHEQIYRDIIRETMADDGLTKLKQGPSNHIQIARIPAWLGPKTATALGLAAYQLEKKIKHPVHPSFGRKLGFYSEFVKAEHCENIEELSDLILASSCTPPFTSLAYRNRKPALDGGLVDNVPVHGAPSDNAPTLILLTRPYPRLPQSAQRLYVQPSQKVPVDSWDYTNPKGVMETFELGRRDGERFIKEFKSVPHIDI